MANTVSLLNYANTFGDWVVTTNALGLENNTLAIGNYRKAAGTLYLENGSLALQSNGNVIFAQQLAVQGFGSSLYVQNNAAVGGQVYFTNTALSLTASGQILASGPGTGLIVANNSILSGNISIAGTTVAVGNVSFANNLVVSKTTNTNFLNVFTNAFIGNSAAITNGTYTNTLLAATSVTTPTVYSTTIFANTVQAYLSVNTASVNTISLSANSSILGNIQANSCIINTIQANTSINTASITTSSSISTPRISISSTIDANNASAYFGSVQSGQFTVNGNFVILGATVYNTNTFTLSANATTAVTSAFIVNRGITGQAAALRWNEPSKYWDMLDVSSGSYYKVLTSNSISDSITSSSTTNIASSNAVYVLNNTVSSNISSLFSLVSTVYSSANSGIKYINGTSGSAIPSSGVVSFLSTNGITATSSSNTITFNTPQDIRSTASPTFNSLVLTNALPIAYGGTGATSSSGALTNLLPAFTTAGYVLASGGPGNYYWAAGGTGGGGSGTTPGTTINSSRLSYTAANSVTQVWTTPAFTNTTQVRSYINGVRQFESEYSLNQSANTITFSVAPTAGDSILIEVDGYYVSPYYANNIAFTVNSSISPTANTIQLAIDQLVSVAAPKISPQLIGTPLAVTAPVGVSNTMIATTGFVYNVLNNSSTAFLGTYLNSQMQGTLAIGNGGTGTTTGTGSGNVVLSTSPTLVTPILGTPQSGNFSTGTFTWPTFNQNTTGTASNITSYPLNQSVSTTGAPTFANIKTSDGTSTQFGGSATTGFYMDATNAAIRTTSAGNIYMQNAGGTSTYGTFNSAGFNGNLNGTWSQLPAGTTTNFYQAAAPTGWTQRTDLNDFMMYIVSGAGGGSGGVHSPITNSVVPAHTHSFSTGAPSNDHTHSDNGHTHNYDHGMQQTVNLFNGGSYQGFPVGPVGTYTTATGYASLTGQSATHTHSGSTDNGSSQTNWSPKYLSNIMCTKS